MIRIYRACSTESDESTAAEVEYEVEGICSDLSLVSCCGVTDGSDCSS